MSWCADLEFWVGDNVATLLAPGPAGWRAVLLSSALAAALVVLPLGAAARAAVLLLCKTWRPLIPDASSIA